MKNQFAINGDIQQKIKNIENATLVRIASFAK
jgi:hypothetical protein